MTRFDAADPAERRKLYVDAITAHRQRGSGFLTLEVDDEVFADDSDGSLEDARGGDERERVGDDGSGADSDPDSPPNLDPDLGTPWIQFGDGTINLDCTDDELEMLKSVLGEFPAFKIDEIHRPEDTDGVNVHVSAKADPNRIAQCLDALFQRVYGLPETVRVWVVEI
ncbi:hypothetical protein GS429_08905 [Natronorubrum sp. JWXQ-INN-674]|uniref:DUF7975 domain-containing protein n=1 Tax=Natronorubrum halalkaliphilum TaxID=2691917 RepID=A0A6B0VMB1_9EURY|nr:hypothetical protein [Natronorubrum halalkaliphilum]MXV62176.1 hypothetical protein [Natronorubrum halalkaliphilum]